MRKSLTKIALGMMLVAATFCLVVLGSILFDGRYQTFQQFCDQIAIGMSQPEVMKLCAENYPTNGRRLRPIVEPSTGPDLKAPFSTVGFTLNPEGQREPGCEMFQLRFSYGRVMSKSYSPD